jgi:ABC-type sugar transport system ATPase subunit
MTASTPHRPAPALSLQGLCKSYGATKALQDVSIDLGIGEVAALTGENGAGKSTLIRIATGVEAADRGALYRDGRAAQLHSRAQATQAGIFCVYQDQPFVGEFPVFRQMYLGYERWFGRLGLVADAKMRRACGDLMAEVGLTSVSPRQKMAALSPGAREIVAVVSVVATARLMEIEHPVIFLDEPTSALSAGDVPILASLIESMKPRSAIAFVSHRVSEVMQWSDVIWVLRDGRNADMMNRAKASPERIHRAMGGAVRPQADHVVSQGSGLATRPGETIPAPQAEPDPGDAIPAFAIEQVRLSSAKSPFSFQVRPGEIVGLAGVEGSGKEELLRICYGLAEGSTGPLRVSGQLCQRQPRHLQRAGVAYLSGERQRDGVLARLSIAENLELGRRCAAGRRGMFIRRGEEIKRAEAMLARLEIKAAGPNAPLRSLSGGNQQKVLLGRCLALSPKVLMLDNVTRGVDIGAKASIHSQLRELAGSGVGLALASDDLEELLALSDRIIVFQSGHLVQEFSCRERRVSTTDLLASMV